ncbi:MAG TPA: hypothetical protein DCY35_06320 [Prolixibacteraceae bacterium]|nr:hypothetical protein [Prolixibacteraceae bacterium]
MKKVISTFAVILAATILLVSMSSGCSKKEQTATITGVKTTLKATVTATKTTTKTATQNGTATDSTMGDIPGVLIPVDPGDNGDTEENGDDENIGNIPDSYIYDFQGATIYIKRRITGADQGGKMDTDYEWANYQPGVDSMADLNYSHWRDIEKKFNCKLAVEFRDSATVYANNTTAEILAGICKYSLTWQGGTFIFPQWHVNKLAVPLDNWIDFDLLPKLNDPIIKDLANYGGKYYTIPDSEPWIYRGICYNIDIRDRMGLPDPHDLYRLGQWTWEKFQELAILATIDFNGDGKTDQYGCNVGTTSSVISKVMEDFIYSNGGNMINYIDGKFVNNINTPSVRRALAFISDLNNIHKVSGGKFVEGQVYMNVGDNFASSVTYYPGKNIRSRFIHVPVGPDNIDGKSNLRKAITGYFIPATEKNPEAIAYLLVNLQWTVIDPDKPSLSYEQRKSDLLKSWISARVDNDLNDLLDYYLIDIRRTLVGNSLDYLSNGFNGMETYMGTVFTNIVLQQKPITTILDESMPTFDSMLAPYN